MRYNGSYNALLDRLLSRPKDSVAHDTGPFFTTPEVRLAGIPFQVRTEGANLVSPPPESP